jgi:hypothetical protein
MIKCNYGGGGVELESRKSLVSSLVTVDEERAVPGTYVLSHRRRRLHSGGRLLDVQDVLGGKPS